MITEWHVKEYDKETASQIRDDCELPRVTSNVLAGRGFKTKEEVDKFCEKSFKYIRNPRKLPDVAKAVERIKKAIEGKEKIYIWGDYDVDGITATAIVVTAFRILGANFVYKVPNRFDDGYDIRRHSVDACIKSECTLLMSVDCGVVAFDTADYAAEKKLDLIITDHHSPDASGRLPKAIAVVNPSRLDSEYGFAGLCGASVAFKLMIALSRELGGDTERIVKETIEFVALGTVADVAPMEDENRILVHHGCKVLSNTSKPGVAELLKIAGAKNVDTTTIGFQIGPRINAIGRLSDPQIAVELLLETDQARAKYLAMQLDTANKRRQSKQEYMVQEALELIEKDGLAEMPAIVCWAKAWHQGLIGLVAGKLAERYHRPTVILAVNDKGSAKGSCRSTKTIHILNILKHPSVLKHYVTRMDGSPVVGGHAFAAGMEVKESELEAFRKSVCDALCELNPIFQPGKRIFEADAKIAISEISDEVFDSLDGLAPFGSGHPEPIFWVKGLNVESENRMSGGKHLKLMITDKKLKFGKGSAILWHKGESYPDDYTGKKVDLLFTFGKEIRNFGSKFYLSIVDIKESL